MSPSDDSVSTREPPGLDANGRAPRCWTPPLLNALVTALLGMSVAAGVFAWPVTAHGQTSEAVAEALFREGKSYFQAEDYARACPKLAQSYKIDPAGGTVLLLAICYEQQGKLASAWARYNDALALAKRDGRQDRERRAREGLEVVEPKLSYVKLLLDPTCASITGLSLSIDGTELPALADTRLPIDPGKHQLVVRAPDYEDWTAEVEVVGASDLKEVAVPTLRRRVSSAEALPRRAPVAATPPILEPPQHARRSNTAMRASAYVLGGAGLAAVAVGSYFGVRAIKLDKQANDLCPTTECGDEQIGALAKVDDARSNARMANILIGAGSAAVISAVVLWYVYRRDPPALDLRADMTTRSVSIAWQHSF